MVFLYGGSFAESVEDWDDNDIVSDCLSVLGRICSVRRVPDPLDYHITRWGKERFSGMAFTYIPPGVQCKENLKAMSRPILDFKEEKPVVQFAGEHTTPFHPSTIHGAFLSGIREAYRLDCAVDPEGVANLVFSEDEIYEPTFTVTKDKKAAMTSSVARSHPVDAQAHSESHSRNRRSHRTAACVMRLRPRSAGSPISNSQPGRDATETEALTEMRSRGNRYQFGRLSKNNAAASAVYDSGNGEQGLDPRDLEALEDRVLLRCLESFGDDYEYIRNKALPVYGGERQKNLSQVRNRCRKLLQESKKVAGSSKAPRIRKVWFSSNENSVKQSNDKS